MAPEEVRRRYWQQAYETLSDCLFQERVAEALLTRWKRFDLGVAVAGALTASGSVVAGLAVWNQSGWSSAWLTLAVAAALAGMIHTAARVPGMVTDEEKYRQLFAGLRVGSESFLHELIVGLEPDQAAASYKRLRDRLEQQVGQGRSDLAATKRLRARVQREVRAEVGERMKGLIDGL